MRFLSVTKIVANAFCVWALSSASGLAQDFTSTKTQGPWIESKPFLNLTKPAEPKDEIPLVSIMKEALVKGFNNIDHQNEVLKMQTEQGTKAQDYGEGYIGPRKDISKADANLTHGLRWRLFTNAKTFAGKEIRVDFVPESIKKGFRFDQTEVKQTVVVNSGPAVRYGLILKDIEPSDDELFVASNGLESDYLYFQNAPKAKVEYEIGPITASPLPERPYGVNVGPDAPAPEFKWKSLLPDHRFRGKFSPRGMPTAAKPLPDQLLSLSQVQGYYSADVQFVNGFHKESVVHRLNMPLYDRFSIYEELNESFTPTKIVINNYIYKGAFSTNIEHYILEKRYRAGFFYRAGYTNLEVYLNLPDTALNSSFSRQQRWELAFQTAI